MESEEQLLCLLFRVPRRLRLLRRLLLRLAHLPLHRQQPILLPRLLRPLRRRPHCPCHSV
nr:MAG TPA: hypothetical protein [Caudoviricetes sp.]